MEFIRIESLLYHLALVLKVGLAPLISGSTKDVLSFSFEVRVYLVLTQDSSFVDVSALAIVYI